MRLSDVWFTALSENESGQMITVYGRDELNEFTESGKFKERVEITWKYEGDGRGLPSDDLGEKMEAVEEALRKAMEKKDKLAILTGVYTGGGEKVWVFYTRTVRVFGERLNEALAPFELLPISIYTEMDPDWEEYKDMYEMKEWAMPIYVFLPAHQERFESLEIFCQLDALLGSFHEGFQFRRDLDICLQYLIDRSFEFGGMGGLEE